VGDCRRKVTLPQEADKELVGVNEMRVGELREEEKVPGKGVNVKKGLRWEGQIRAW
jgi:hypothetical protein